LLSEFGIEYRSLPELGNLFLDYEDWRERYTELLARAGDLQISRLAVIPGNICLLCAEKRSEECVTIHEFTTAARGPFGP
jgi:hypothetical protein